MNFLPNDLQNIVFRKAIGGYNILQVEDVILKVVEDLSGLIKENIQLKEKLQDSQESVKYYRGIENTLHNSLIVAQKTSDDIIANARDNAENINKEAELNAQRVVEQAHKEILTVKFEYERLRQEVSAYKFKMESLISSQLKLMESMGPNQVVKDINSEFDYDLDLEDDSYIESDLDLEDDPSIGAELDLEDNSDIDSEVEIEDRKVQLSRI